MDKDGNTLIKAKPRPGVSGINRVLVTGGAGFVGSHLIGLMARGDHVMCLDSNFTGSKENIGIIGKPNFEIVRHDVVEPILLECDQCTASVPRLARALQVQPVKTIKTNVIGAEHARLGEARQGALFDNQHFRGVQRPSSAPSDGGVLGQRQPHRRALVLRRRQEVRGDAGV